MIVRNRERRRVTISILLISLTMWAILLVDPGGLKTAASCCVVTDSGSSSLSFETLLEMNPISSLAAGWALMLVAMMAPMLIAPIHYIRDRSFKRRRFRAVVLLVVGYAAIWMVAGAVLIAMQLALGLVAPQSYLPAVMVGIIAFVWQCSPIKQRCLNRCHNHGAMAAFGAAADRDALRLGIEHGVWCVGSCWALMLLPMLLLQWHMIAMVAVTFVMIGERFEHSGPLTWRLRFPSKLVRIVVAQTRIRWQRLPLGSRAY